MLPPGTPQTPAGACGTHLAALTTHPHRDPLADNAPPAYLIIPYPGPGCLFSDFVVDNLTLVFSHELAEAITQPFNIGSEGQSGWWGFTNGGNGTTPPPLAQIADACEPNGSTLSLSNGGTAYVSNILDLNQGHCVSFK